MNRLIAGPQNFWTKMRRSIDWVVLTLTIGVMVLGLINLNSADFGDWEGQFVTDQITKMLVGAVAMGVAATIHYKVLHRTAYPIYGATLALILLVTVIGVTTNSATRWLDLPFFPRFQPSEFMKLGLVVGLARWLHDHDQWRQKQGGAIPWNWARILLVPGLLTLVPAALIVKQPNLSTGIMLVLIALTLLAATELGWRSMLAILSAAVVGFLVAWRFLFEDYQATRVEVWLDPEAHPEDAYQILQARTAVGNGGFFGRGVGQGTQNVLDFIPYSESDFSFAVFAEEWGFVGSALLLALFLSIILWALNIASQAPDRFSSGLCIGVAALVFWHVVLNVGVVLELFPNTGLPLPFFTHGGSNVVTIMLALGILMSVSRSRRFR